jgi:hypothetical protein
MPGKRVTKPICSLTSEYSEMPGASWMTEVSFRLSKDEICGSITCEHITQTEEFFAEPSAWRAIAMFLADNDSGWGTPWDACLHGESQVFEPYQMDVILLCWLRYEGEQCSKWGNLVLSLPDSWIETAHASFGNLVPDIETLYEFEYDTDIGELDPTCSWYFDLYLLDLTIDDRDKFIDDRDSLIDDVADDLGIGLSEDLPQDLFRLLRNRHQEFKRNSDRIEKEIIKSLGPIRSSIEGMGRSSVIQDHLRQQHGHFLRTGTVLGIVNKEMD